MANTEMLLVTPLVAYKAIKVNNIDITLSGSAVVSFNSPYNSVAVTIQPTNCSLNYYEVRVTKDGVDYGIGLGTKAYYMTNVPANTDTTFSIPVNSTTFTEGDGKYRVSLYAQSAVDNSWDATYILIDLSGNSFITTSGEVYEVLTDEDTPS